VLTGTSVEVGFESKIQSEEYGCFDLTLKRRSVETHSHS